MNVCELGTATLHTRVEKWECDFNGHWNTRFYGRSFQLAAELVAARFAESASNARLPQVRHIRFHRELFASDTVEVRSAQLTGGNEYHDASIVHLLVSNGSLSATALDRVGAIRGLPSVPTAEVPFALPRGIDTSPAGESLQADAACVEVEFGPVRPADVDHAGELLFEEIIRLGSVASTIQLESIGFTAAFSAESNIVRVAAEMRVTRFAPPPAGALLRGQSWVSNVRSRSFRTNHRVTTITGDVVAILEICQVTVDKKSRRAVRVPDLALQAGH